MSSLSRCRICLVNTLRMCSITNGPLQKVFEKLTDTPLHTNDKKPVTMCYICCSHLRKCYKLMQMAKRSDKLLSEMLSSGKESKSLQDLSDMRDGVCNFRTEPIYNMMLVDTLATMRIKHETMQVVRMKKEDDEEELSSANGSYDSEPFSKHAPCITDNTVPDKLSSANGSYDSKPLSKHDPCIYGIKSPYKTVPDINAKTEDISDIYDTVEPLPVEHYLKIISDDNVKKKDTFQCDYCKKYLSTKSILITHITRHIKPVMNVKKPYKCNYCHKCFSKNWNLTIHLRMHTGEKPYKCKFCSKQFGSSSNLTNHTRIHTGEKPYKCKYCIKSFRQFSQLSSHLRIHTGEKPYMCQYCSKCFSLNAHLNRHLAIVHVGEKPYKCKHCGKCFGANYNLNNHVRIHTGEKPFKCKYCSKCFGKKSSLTDHLRIHTGEKPYKCVYCEKCFSTNSNLTGHLKIHTGEKSYKSK